MNLSGNPIYKSLDWLWRKIVKAGKDRCEICGGTEILECHHIVGRKDYWLRWDPKNGLFVDRRCHSRPDIILEWFRLNNPARYDYLMRKKNDLHRGQKIDLKVIEMELYSQL
jgi:hypothetical protein